MLATMLDKYLEKRRFEMSLSRQHLPSKKGEIIFTTELQSAKGDRFERSLKDAFEINGIMFKAYPESTFIVIG